MHLQFRKQAHTLSLTEFGLVLGLFFVSPAALLAAQFVGAGRRTRRAPPPAPDEARLQPRASCRSAAASRCSSSARSTTATRTACRTWALVLIAAAVAHTVGVLLVSAVIAVVEGQTRGAAACPDARRSPSIGALATASLGLAGVLLIDTSARGRPPARPPRRHLRARVPRLHDPARAARAPRVPLRVDARDAGSARVRPCRGPAAGRGTAPAPCRVRGDPADLADRGRAGAPKRQRRQRRDADASRGALRSRQPRIRAYRRHGRTRCCCVGDARAHEFDAFLAARALDDAIIGALRGEERVFGFLLVGDRIGRRRHVRRRPTASCSRHSRVTPASCSRTDGSSTRSPR